MGELSWFQWCWIGAPEVTAPPAISGLQGNTEPRFTEYCFSSSCPKGQLNQFLLWSSPSVGFCDAPQNVMSLNNKSFFFSEFQGWLGFSGLHQLLWLDRIEWSYRPVSWQLVALRDLPHMSGSWLNVSGTMACSFRLWQQMSLGLWTWWQRFPAAREGMPQCIGSFQVLLSIIFANVPLAKESHMAKTRFKGWRKRPVLLIRVAAKSHYKGIHTRMYTGMVGIIVAIFANSTMQL